MTRRGDAEHAAAWSGGTFAAPTTPARRIAAWPVAAGTALLTALAMPALAQGEAGMTGAGDATTVPASKVALSEVDAYRLTLFKMNGHLRIARALIRQRAEGAEYHLGEAMRALYQQSRPAFEARSAPLTTATLDELESAAALEPARALRAVESGATAVNGSFAQTGPMDLDSVLDIVEVLLAEAVAKYAEAVVDNAVVDLRAYQTGRSYVTQAEILVRHSSALKGRERQEDLVFVVMLIAQSWPGIMPPPIVFDPASVAERLHEARAVMETLR